MAEIIRREIASDASGTIVSEAGAVELHVNHPDKPDAPTQRLDFTTEEAEALSKLNTPMVRVIIVGKEGEPDKEVYVSVKQFDGLFRGVGKKAIEVLVEAPVVGLKAKAKANGNGEERDYASAEWAGTPKKGKTSAEEAAYVREHLAEVNARLKQQGLRLIDPNNPEHARRYGLVATAEPAAAPEATAQ